MKNRNSKLYVLLLMTLFAGMSTALFAEQRIAVIDMEKVFTEYYKTKIEDAKLKKQTDVFKQYLTTLNDAREKIQIEYIELRDASQNIALSDAEREKKRVESLDKYRELQAKDTEIQQYNQQKRTFLVDEYERIRKGLTGEITTVILSKAKREDYRLVLDSSGNTMNNIPAIVYFDPSMDITDQIIKEINLGNEATAAAMAEANSDN
ncbi:MAG TPA: hypothetical protein DD381_14400 [Lentisphaeria bacterium]|nr:MAG: hypothetical protein A2X47_00870 [Lentisphaerae bacterium GWF2_38_69]HBM17516.1 hypothetical protein [Lentisphaeria bacterium]